MTTIIEALGNFDCAHLVCEHKEGGYILAEIQTSDYWIGGKEDGYTDNSNTYFDTPQQAQSFYNREYGRVWVFDDEYDAVEKIDELEDKGE